MRYIMLSFVAIIIATLVVYVISLIWLGSDPLDARSCMMGMVGMGMINVLYKAFKLDKMGLSK